MFSLLRLALYGLIGSANEAFCLEQLRNGSEHIQLQFASIIVFIEMLESEKTGIIGSF